MHMCVEVDEESAAKVSCGFKQLESFSAIQLKRLLFLFVRSMFFVFVS